MYSLIFDRSKFYLYPWYFADEVLTYDIEKIFARKMTEIILEFKDGHVYYYANLSELNELGSFLLDRVKNNRQFYKTVQGKILESGKELTDFCKGVLTTDIKNSKDSELADLYFGYASKIKPVRAWGWVPPLIDGMDTPFLSNYLEEQFKNFADKHSIDAKTAAEHFSVLSSSDKMSEVQNEEIARLELLKQIQETDRELLADIKNGPQTESLRKLKQRHSLYTKIVEHAKKFEWLPYAYEGPGLSAEGVINLMKDNLLAGDVDSQIKQIQEHYKKLPSLKNKIIEDIHLTEDLQYLFNIYGFFMYIKDMRKGLYQQSYVVMDAVLQEIANRSGLTLKETKFLTADEIKDALEKKKDFKPMVKQRTQYCMALISNGKTRFLSANEIATIKARISQDEIDETAAEIKGSVAYVGSITGIAKIVATTDDIPKINVGDILISPTTNPDLLPAMKKAAAFVTDMGGITSHAAIVSRELKKPCIVGTKIATKIIKDGDLVEVDAINGFVKVVQKNEA